MLGLATPLKVLREKGFLLELGTRFGRMNAPTRFM